VDHDDGRLPADAVVLAVDASAVGGLLPAGAIPDPSRVARLGSSPIVSIHVWFDRPVLGVPVVAAVDTPLT
jgi:hypothetical protein